MSMNVTTVKLARDGVESGRTIPDSPPPEVLSAIAVAAGAADRLAEEGYALHFELGVTTGRVTVQVHDLDGNILCTLPPRRALELAVGAVLR